MIKKGFFDLAAVKNVISVYGDDILLPNNCVNLLSQCFGFVGIVFNHEKTFFGDNPFRESCGQDFYSGYNVRPLYLKAPESTRFDFLEPWLYTIMNGYFKAIIPFAGNLRFVYESSFLETIACIFESYNLRMKIIPSHFPASSGVHICYWDHRVERYFSNVRTSLPDKYDIHGNVRITYLRYESRTLNVFQIGNRFVFKRDSTSTAFDKQWYWYSLKAEKPSDTVPTRGLLRELALFFKRTETRSREMLYVDKGKGGYKTARVRLNIGHVV